MDRTRAIFIAIVGLALLLVCGIGFFSVASNLFNGTNSTDTPASSFTDPDNVPSGTVLLPIASSNTKRDWLDQVVESFNAAENKTAAGNVIKAEVQHVTSGGSMNAILDGELKPVVWSPGDQSWVAQANAQWKQRTNQPLISQECPATIYAPLGFAMWRPMAEAMGWPDKPIGWDTIVDLASNPKGWEAYGHPEWGQFRFGHTHPGYANSGLLSMTAFVYGVAGKTEGLTAADVYSPKVEEAMRKLEQVTAKYGSQAPALLELMTVQGPSYLHAAAVPEANVLQYNIQRGDELRFPLVFIFPAGGTIWADHPYCILDNADWVTDEQQEAAAVFRDYLLSEDQQKLAIDNFLRPLDPNIPLHAPLDLATGTDPRVTTEQIPALPSPSAEVSEAVVDLFLTTKRKATVIVVLDVSGSMEGEKIRTATQSTADFLKRLYPDDKVALIAFNNEVKILSQPDEVRNVVEDLSNRVITLIADGGTSLHGAVCQATQLAAQMKEEDQAAGENRLYGIVLLSDGMDTEGTPSEGKMFATCLPSQAEADGVKIFPIAFGEDADTDVLQRIANVTGGRLFKATPGTIDKIYLRISAEQ
ncbi:MAG TPA: VWA domain-containing protein [Anaerolineae bacterium]|nr:VWA domain-containing protein [Anaerolineae bacterium]